MKIPDVKARTSGSIAKENRRTRVNSWLSQLRQTVEVARRAYPELANGRLEDVAVQRDGTNRRITLTFRGSMTE